eukprot:gene10312-5488_t
MSTIGIRKRFKRHEILSLGGSIPSDGPRTPVPSLGGVRVPYTQGLFSLKSGCLGLGGFQTASEPALTNACSQVEIDGASANKQIGSFRPLQRNAVNTRHEAGTLSLPRQPQPQPQFNSFASRAKQMCKWEQGDFAAEGCWAHTSGKGCRYLHRDQVETAATQSGADFRRQQTPRAAAAGAAGAAATPSLPLQTRAMSGADFRSRRPAHAMAKLQKAENAFVISTKRAPVEKNTMQQCTQRLNKLTLEKFDRLAIQIKDLLVADLAKVPALVKAIFEKAIDEEFFSMIYAKLCKYLAVATSAGDAAVEAISGFRKILLTCCQHEFEKAARAESDYSNAREAAKGGGGGGGGGARGRRCPAGRVFAQ